MTGPRKLVTTKGTTGFEKNYRIKEKTATHG